MIKCNKQAMKSPLGKTIIRVLGARKGKGIVRSLVAAQSDTFDIMWSDKDPMEFSWLDSPQVEDFWSRLYSTAYSKGLIE